MPLIEVKWAKYRSSKIRTQLFHNSAHISSSELLVLVSVEQVKSCFEVSDLIVVQQRGGLFAL